MIEVFKTDVSNREVANGLLTEIQTAFAGYKVNFDLSDSDKILRVVCDTENFSVSYFMHWLTTRACNAEVLPD